jgi:hypothetical protein
MSVDDLDQHRADDDGMPPLPQRPLFLNPFAGFGVFPIAVEGGEWPSNKSK